MDRRDFKPRRTFGFRTIKPKPKGDPNPAEPIGGVQGESKSRQTGFDYRTASLKIHGPVCGRCGREFAGKNLRMLTVHHKDGNHNNNPRDGSNWENLCVYCHDDEHSRGLLADYISSARDEDAVDPGKRTESESASEQGTAPGEGKTTLAEKLAEALKKSDPSHAKNRRR